MRIRLPRWRTTGATLLAVAVLLPGWSADLVPEDHEAILAATSRARHPTGVVRPAGDGEPRWDLQYLDCWSVRMLDEMGLRRAAPALVPPDFAARISAETGRAEGYYRVESRLRWPWWLPGGGVDWEAAPAPR